MQGWQMFKSYDGFQMCLVGSSKIEYFFIRFIQKFYNIDGNNYEHAAVI